MDIDKDGKMANNEGSEKSLIDIVGELGRSVLAGMVRVRAVQALDAQIKQLSLSQAAYEAVIPILQDDMKKPMSDLQRAHEFYLNELIRIKAMIPPPTPDELKRFA